MEKGPDLQSNTRLKIMEAAIEEFAVEGLAGARVDRIARRAGVNKAMIYYHFSSKANLYREMLESQIARIADSMKGIIDSPTDLEKSFLEISRMYHDILTSDARFPRILLHELADGGKVLMETLLTSLSHQGLPNRILKRLEEGRISGLLRDVDLRHTMISFVGMNMYYLLAAPIVNSVLEIEDDREFCRKRPAEVVDLFLRGLMAR
jgi:TetR/AcrR family transcriptional regulator